MCVATSEIFELKFWGFDPISSSKNGTRSCDNLESKGFVDSPKEDRVKMAKVRALSQVVPDFGRLLRITSLG